MNVNKPTSLDDFKHALSSDCIFTVEGKDGLFIVKHNGKSIEVSDISSAPECYCETFDSIDCMIDNMLVGELRYDETSKRVKVLNGIHLCDCLNEVSFRQ